MDKKYCLKVNNYLSLYKDYFWQWEDGAQVIAIPDGHTIVYRQLVAEIIEELAPDGLPPFGSIILALAALHPQGQQNIDQIFEIINKIENVDAGKYSDEAFAVLKLLNSMPAKYKTGDLKKYVLRAFFRNSHNRSSIKKGLQIAEDFNNFNHNYIPTTPHQSSVDRDFRVIALLNREFDSVESIINKINALPDLQENLILESSEKEGPKDFIEELIMNPGTHKIGALVKVLWSGLNLPVRSSKPSQLPMGGVSDLTNKGELSQLLISEFANDDLIFLSRLANNEALYLNRESPPVDNDMRRVVLIDVSLKNWGTPKTIAFATMLAIAKHPKTTIDCDVFVVGKSFQKVIYNSVEGIMAAIQIVDPSIEASKGLQQYFETFPPNNNQEVFVLTERTTKNNANMLRLKHELGTEISYWIYNGSDGHIDVYKNLKSSSKHLQHLELPFEDLWNKKHAKKLSNNENRSSKGYFPILFRAISRNRAIAIADKMVFMLTKGKVLYRLSSSELKHHEKGWEFIMNDLPFYDFRFNVGCMSNGEYLLIMHDIGSKQIVLVNLNSNKVILRKDLKIEIRATGIFHFYKDKFFHVHDNGTMTIDASGKIEEKSNEVFNFDSEKLKKEKALIDYHSKHKNRHNILRKINQIGISDKGYLMCNTSQLSVAFGGHLKLETRKGSMMKIRAQSTENGVFRFEDGSEVRNTFQGMIILTSSSQHIPPIYVPTVLNAALAAATHQEFSGNRFYYNEPLYDVVIDEEVKSKLAVIKILRVETALGLGQLNVLTDLPSFRVPYLFNNEKSKKVIEELVMIGCKAHRSSLTTGFDKNLDIISIERFYATHIEAFLDEIKTYYGTKA